MTSTLGAAAPVGNRTAGLTGARADPYRPRQVMSASVKPRLAGRQPSSAVGCSG